MHRGLAFGQARVTARRLLDAPSHCTHTHSPARDFHLAIQTALMVRQLQRHAAATSADSFHQEPGVRPRSPVPLCIGPVRRCCLEDKPCPPPSETRCLPGCQAMPQLPRHLFLDIAKQFRDSLSAKPDSRCGKSIPPSCNSRRGCRPHNGPGRFAVYGLPRTADAMQNRSTTSTPMT